MKSIFCFLSLLFCLNQNQAQLTLKILGIDNMEGSIYVGLYNKSEGFTEIEKTYKNWILKATDKTLRLELRDVPPGIYALSIFHDQNENGKLDKNFLGIPIEIYGFSNNARELFSAPTYQDCSFSFSEKLHLEVKLD